VKVWQESTRHWLMELALAGFQQLEYATLAPFTATLEQMQGEPALTRLAALLTGFLQELLDALPVATLPDVPAYRWVDLWTRAMVGSLRPPDAQAGEKVGGNLSILGLDLRHHGYFASFDAYGLLEGVGPTRVVRTTLSSYKVDVVLGAEMWQCFPKTAEPLLRAVSERKTLKLRDATLLPTGDLLWGGPVSVGGGYSCPDLAAKWLAPGAATPALPAVAAADRHPVQLAEPVYLEGYQAQDGEAPFLDFGDGVRVDIAANRLSRASELQPEQVAKSKSLVGLLRFDGGQWSVQPLAVALTGPKAAEAFTGSGALAALGKGKKGNTLAVLQERASRLLRKKS
jgi:hypothetical protein